MANVGASFPLSEAGCSYDPGVHALLKVVKFGLEAHPLAQMAAARSTLSLDRGAGGLGAASAASPGRGHLVVTAHRGVCRSPARLGKRCLSGRGWKKVLPPGLLADGSESLPGRDLPREDPAMGGPASASPRRRLALLAAVGGPGGLVAPLSSPEHWPVLVTTVAPALRSVAGARWALDTNARFTKRMHGASASERGSGSHKPDESGQFVPWRVRASVSLCGKGG